MHVEFFMFDGKPVGPIDPNPVRVMDSSEIVIPRVGERVYGLDWYHAARVTRVNHIYTVCNPRVEVFLEPVETTVLASLTIGPDGEAIHGDHRSGVRRWWTRRGALRTSRLWVAGGSTPRPAIRGASMPAGRSLRRE